MNQCVKQDLLPLLKLAIPLILTNVVQSSLPFIETIFLSRLGEDTLAAGALVSWLFATMIVIIFGTFSAINILIAHQHGAKNDAAIIHILRDGLLLALLFSGPTFLLFWKISPLLLILGQSEKLASLATLYLHALAFGLFPKFILIVLFEFVLGLGHSRVIMKVTILSIPIYILFSYAFIFGKFGLPALGIAGAGWGMTVSDWIISTSCFILLFLSKTYKPYITSIFNLKKPFNLWEILHLGLPMGIMYCFEVAFFFAVTLVMGVIGVQALAANQITMQYLGPFAGIIFCIAQAITVRMGHQIGANEKLEAKRTAKIGIALSSIFMVVIALFYWTIPKLLISVDFDIHNPNYFETVTLATSFFYIAALFQIIESIRIALFGVLRALKDTKFTLLTSIISFWLIALPFGYTLAKYFSIGGAGLWWGMCFGAGVNVLLLGYRYKSKMNRLND